MILGVIMSKKIITFLTLLVLAISISGCEKASEVKDSISQTVQSSEGYEAEKAKEPVADMPKIEPVPIPEGGWTEDTISDVIYVNDKNIHLPCKFEEFGEGFELSIDEYTSFDNGYAFVNFKYNDIMIGGMAVNNCTDADSIKNGNVVSIECVSDYLEDGSNNLVPVEVNSVTLGSSKSDVEDYLDFDIDELEENNVYYASGYIGKYHIWCLIKDDSVTSLHIQYIENN